MQQRVWTGRRIRTERLLPRSMKYSAMVTPAYGARYCAGAESAAVAPTIMVYSIAPCCSKVRTIRAIVEAFLADSYINADNA